MTTSLRRVTSIPLIADSISNLHEVLLSNGLTRAPYNLSLAIGEKALNLSQPIQNRLAPVIDCADSLANKGLDAVQSRYPYPFETPSQDIYQDIKAYPDHAVQIAHKAANNVAHDIDQRLTPLVNSYESVLTRISPYNKESKSPFETDSEVTQDSVSDTAHSQVERAYKLTLDLRNRIYSLSSEQLSHHQTLAAIVQKVTETVYEVNTQIANSYLNVKGKGVQLKDATQAQVHQVGQSIHSQLDKVQEMSKSLPSHIQSSLHPIQSHLSQTLTSLTLVLKSETSMSDKATQLRQIVLAEVQPLLDSTLDYVHAYSEATRKFVGAKVSEAENVAEREARKIRGTKGETNTPRSSVNSIADGVHTITEATWKLFGLKVREIDHGLDEPEEKKQSQGEEERIHSTDGAIATAQDLRANRSTNPNGDAKAKARAKAEPKA